MEYLGTGRRKTAVARVRMLAGTGKITINGRPIENYFHTEVQRMIATQPLVLTENQAKFDVRINVGGGGPAGQAGAVRHGISRALLQADGATRPALKA